MARVVLTNVTKKYLGTAKPAVKDLSLEVSDREFTVLLGDPGAGKTTTLRLIAGLEKPSSGQIFLDDVLVNSWTPQERDVAMVFQSFALYPHRTAYENIAFPLRKRKLPKTEIDRLVRDAARLLGITELLEKRPPTLSGGEKQRVALARAIVRTPKVYLFDEPLSNLDAKLRIQMRVEMRKIQREFGQTIIYATADESEAMVMADKIAVMHEGEILQYDVKGTIYDSPKNVRVATMIGSPPMNLLDCSLVRKNGQALLDFGEFSLDISDLPALPSNTASALTFGVRPSDVIVQTGNRNGSSIKAAVDAVENVGDSLIMDLSVGKTTLQAAASADYALAKEKEVWVSFRKAKLHLFNRNSGETIR